MWKRCGLRACCVAVLAAASCERGEPTGSPQPPASPVPGAGGAWRMLDGPGEAAVAAAADDPQMEAAIERARATVEKARLQWQADPGGRDAWAVKWAAPTVGGGVEHVWVRPLSWTRFRIEGRLASQPQTPLICGRVAGELVGFPAEQLSDWLHLLGGTVDGPREGGFTIDVLEQQHGAP
jgi:uncharacterized protein YegJ (DUF2314 family)